MHELGVLRNAVNTVAAVAKQNNIKKIKHITLEMGMESSFVPMFFEKRFPVAIDGLELFEGAELNAIFGGIKCDLRNAIIEKDCEIKLSAIFGGVDILLPANVMVDIDSTSIFGGMSDNRIVTSTSGVTVHIKGLCLFGGADIK